MIFARLSVWIVYSNGNPYSWQRSRSAAFAERKHRAELHPHARWTVAKKDAELRLLNEEESPTTTRDGCEA